MFIQYNKYSIYILSNQIIQNYIYFKKYIKNYFISLISQMDKLYLLWCKLQNSLSFVLRNDLLLYLLLCLFQLLQDLNLVVRLKLCFCIFLLGNIWKFLFLCCLSFYSVSSRFFLFKINPLALCSPQFTTHVLFDCFFCLRLTGQNSHDNKRENNIKKLQLPAPLSQEVSTFPAFSWRK